MNNKFETIFKGGLTTLEKFPDDTERQCQIAKVTFKRLENEIIRVSALALADENGNIPPTSKEELLKL